MKDREMWMDKLKEKLENYSEPIPPFGWEPVSYTHLDVYKRQERSFLQPIMSILL